MYDIDFTTPNWLIIYYNSIGLLSILMSIFGMYILIFKCRELDSYRYYLIGFLMCCTLTDLNLTFLFKPIPLYPLIAGYNVGFLNQFMEDANLVAMTIMFFMSISHLQTLLLCFTSKHQLLAEILKKHVIPRWLDAIPSLVAISAPFLVSTWFALMGMAKEKQWKYLNESIPEYLDGFKTLPNFLIFPKSLEINLLMITLLCGGSWIIFLFFVFIIDIFLFMKTLKTKMAKSTYKKHEDAVRSLQVQLGTSLICLIPPGFVVSVVFLEVGNAQFLTELAIAWYACHDVLNMTTMLIFFPPYRKFLKKTFEKISGKTKRSTNSSLVVI